MIVHLVSLGCAKNLVDSEIMLGRLAAAGWQPTPNPSEADVIVVNTCSFIEPAVEESIDTILELSRYKSAGRCKKLVVAGCLPERYREELPSALPEVDLFLGTGAFDDIVPILEGSHTEAGILLPNPELAGKDLQQVPRLLSTYPMAYLKIAEGCSRHCTYCIIPKLRGKHRSRPMEILIKETRSLISEEAKEINIVAQDTTAYGTDLYPQADIADLLENLAKISPSVWLRLLYGHPNTTSDKLIHTIAKRPNICSYFDVPIQHVSERILKLMGRHYSQKHLHDLFGRIRSICPDAALRTTIIVGFPGETEKDFDQLENFIREIKFNHVGVFVYSDAQDLPSHGLAKPVPQKMALQRRERLMRIQAEISFNKNQSLIGKEFNILLEETTKDGDLYGRTWFQAPEVDGVTIISAKSVSSGIDAGMFIRVKIVDATEYDLIGEPV